VGQAGPPAPQQLSTRISVATQAQSPAVTGPAEPQVFNGELIDLDLKQADLGDFFRLVADMSGLNVVVDQNVTGSVTVTLKEVPWDQALDIVLRNHSLGGILEGRNVLRIATRATLQAEDSGTQSAARCCARCSSSGQQELCPELSQGSGCCGDAVVQPHGLRARYGGDGTEKERHHRD
jgi:type IV pilus assembly protein PilQ